MEALWSLLTIVGPILLIGVLLWAMLRNRKVGDRQTRRTEEATADLRDRIDEKDKRDELGR